MAFWEWHSPFDERKYRIWADERSMSGNIRKTHTYMRTYLNIILTSVSAVLWAHTHAERHISSSSSVSGGGDELDSTQPNWCVWGVSKLLMVQLTNTKVTFFQHIYLIRMGIWVRRKCSKIIVYTYLPNVAWISQFSVSFSFEVRSYTHTHPYAHFRTHSFGSAPFSSALLSSCCSSAKTLSYTSGWSNST